jgi:hypothetical protein
LLSSAANIGNTLAFVRLSNKNDATVGSGDITATVIEEDIEKTWKPR